jgi:UrcA family protein
MRAFSGSAIALLLTISSASAQHVFGPIYETQDPHGTVRAMPVQFGDLDVAREEGAKALLGRLTVAARRVCEPADAGDLNMQVIYQRCLHVAMYRAVADIGSPLVASLYTGQPLAVAQTTYHPAVASAYRHTARNSARHLRHYARSAKRHRA